MAAGWWKRKRFWVLAVVAVAVGIVLLDQGMVWKGRFMTVGKDTTRIMGPLSPEGYPDYLAAINGEGSIGVTPENNAAPLILEVLRTELGPGAWREAVWKKLGITAEEAGKGPAYVNLQTWQAKIPEAPVTDPASAEAARAAEKAAEDLDEEMDKAKKGPWAPADHPAIAAWLKENEGALARLEEACKRSRFYVPCATTEGTTEGAAGNRMLDIQMPWLGPCRGLSDMLAARAMLRLGAGDVEGYSHDVVLMLKLARLVWQQPTLIDGLVAVAMDANGMQTAQSGAATEKLSEKQADALRGEIERLAALGNMSGAVDKCERYMVLDAICTIHKGAGTGTAGVAPGGLTHWLRVMPMSYDGAMRQANRYFDRIVGGMELPTLAQRRVALDKVEKETEGMRGAGMVHQATHPAELILLIFLPSFKRVNEVQMRGLVYRDLAETALALRAYKGRKRAFPEGLEDLKGADGGGGARFEAPVDRFTERALVYRKKGEVFILYSVGENLKDDGGVERGKGKGREDDVVVEAER